MDNNEFDKRYTHIIQQYERMLQEHPDERNCLNGVGDFYATHGERKKACELYFKVAPLSAQDGSFFKAIAVYKKAQRPLSESPTHT